MPPLHIFSLYPLPRSFPATYIEEGWEDSRQSESQDMTQVYFAMMLKAQITHPGTHWPFFSSNLMHFLTWSTKIILTKSLMLFKLKHRHEKLVYLQRGSIVQLFPYCRKTCNMFLVFLTFTSSTIISPEVPATLK